MSRWISLYWTWLLPALAILAVLVRLHALRVVRQRGLISRRGWRWMVLALAATLGLIVLTQLVLAYPTTVWLPLGGLAAMAAMLAALRAARAEIHPGLRGLQRPLPRDGLELIEFEERPLHRRHWREWNLNVGWPLLAALGVIVYLAVHFPERWLDWVVLGVIFAAPLSLTPYRGQWIAPLVFAPALLWLALQSSTQSARLPPGVWATPLTGARCPGQLRVSAQQAWCANAFTGAVYQFDLRTGVVNLEPRVSEGVRVFAANGVRAWVQQNPASGLIVVDAEADSLEPLRVLSAHSGAADAEGRLWVIDVGMELSMYANGSARPLRAKDGLLNNTASRVKVSPAGGVWVGSIGGVSWLSAREASWQTLRRETSGLPGAVINFAFEAEGTVWMLWQARPGYAPRSDWGVSALHPDGTLRHFALGAQTGLETPLIEDALAVDGFGRLWFATQSIPGREKFLGLVDLDAGRPPRVYSLGRFATRGPYAYGTGLWPYSFGVVSDGAGGILLYNGDAEPWRYWKP